MGKGKAEIKRFVVLDTGAIVDLAAYGMGTWGSTCQCGAKVVGDKVYETDWSYGGEWEEDVEGEVLLGTIVYSSDKPFRVLESSASSTAAEPDYTEYGADLGKAFGTNADDRRETEDPMKDANKMKKEKETNKMKKEKAIMKALERLTPAVGWSPFDHRANQKALGNLGTLEKMADYLLGRLSEDSAAAEGNDDREHCDMAFEKRKALERLRGKYFNGKQADDYKGSEE